MDKTQQRLANKERRIEIAFIVILTLLSFLVFFYKYWNPPALFWDENYHISSAEKYMNHAFFMEAHPPLGKLFIALGEYIIHPNKNIDTASFLNTDYINNVPDNYSFAGMRFFPVLFAFLCPILFFLILHRISKNNLVSFCFSLIFILNNALIAHFRAVMLDSIQLFFILASILCFCCLLEKRSVRASSYFFLGLLSSLAISVKLNSAILLLLFPALYIKEKIVEKKGRKWQIRNFRDFPLKALLSVLGLALVFCLVWQIHFSIAKTVVDNRYYGASDAYKQILSDGKTSGLKNFVIMLRDNLKYMHNYESGVPQLDVCKADENGSSPLSWIIGGKSINYRWESDGTNTRYLYLQSNPAVWLIGLIGVLLSVSLCVSVLFFGLKIKDKRSFYYIAVFLLLYLCYMAAMLTIKRVLYLYHYFIPLTFALILSALVLEYAFLGNFRGKKIMRILLGIMLVSVIAFFLLFLPLTYYLPLTKETFLRIASFSWNGLKPV